MKLVDTPRDDSEDKTRQRIVLYAQRVFFERGFRKVTVDELCAGMALSKRTFYKHFANRDELVEAVLWNSVSAPMQDIVTNLMTPAPAQTVLERHFQLLQRFLLTSISLPFMADIEDLMPELWARIEERRRAVVELVANLLERGQREGVLRPDLNPFVLTRVFQRLVTVVADPSFLRAEGLSMVETVKTMKTLVLHGVLADHDAKE
jgi:AcrR family transcriptional regulator